MNKKFPKVLFISHNAFSNTHNNGKTYSSLFADWPKEYIAQLYFHNEQPNFDVCENYYLVTDEHILKRKKKDSGQIITINNMNDIKKTQSPLHSYVRKKSMPVFTTIRDIVWSSNKWNNARLHNWLESFAPEIIFFVGGGSKFSYKITKAIADQFEIPVLLYYTDDYVTSGPSLGAFGQLNLFRLRSYLKEFMPIVKKMFVIGEDMKVEFSSRFKKECIPIMNSVNMAEFEQNHQPVNVYKEDDTITIAYFGGIHLNRWHTLAKLGEFIKKLHETDKIKFKLCIYTNQVPDKEIFNQINQLPYIEYKGSVESHEIINEMYKYDLLIHAESFDKEMIHKTRLSISTKIPEYLATGRPIIGIGPGTLSSIKYLKNHTNAFILESLNETDIINLLREVQASKDAFNWMGEKNIEVARQNHSIEREREKVKVAIMEAVFGV